MPMPGFLSSFADKAQSAINASPLAGHLPAAYTQRPGSPDPALQPAANDAAAQGSKSHAMDTLTYQFRSLQQQYTTTTPVQKIITTEKGVAIDFDGVSRDSKAQSKELYTWGQAEPADLKDVTDRLAYLNFVQGSLASSLSVKLDSARNPFKALRDAEAALTPRRNIRAGIQLQIGRLEHDQQKGNKERVVELRDQLKKAELEDVNSEREIDILKRKAVRESEQVKWDAIREYGEKLVLLSQAAKPIIAVLPAIPPTPSTPYQGAQTTGAVRASLQRALDNYKTGHINLPPQSGASDLSRSDTRSFGESHASELSSLHSDATSYSATHDTPLNTTSPLPAVVPASHENRPQPPINPATLNQSPAPIPIPFPSPSAAAAAPVPSSTSHNLPYITPTVAETGVPISAGSQGPGPASGSLHDIRAASAFAGPQSGVHSSHAPGYGQPPSDGAFVGGLKPLSAEEEKRRLASTYAQQDSSSATSPPVISPIPAPAPAAQPHRETAEEEKKRLEREERERILAAGGSAPPQDKEEDLPPYQEPGLQ